MQRVGVRELRQKASEILRRVAAGEAFEVTDRGRPAAILSTPAPTGLHRLEQQGLVRLADGNLADFRPLPLPRGRRPPSALIAEGRGD